MIVLLHDTGKASLKILCPVWGLRDAEKTESTVVGILEDMSSEEIWRQQGRVGL